MPEEPFKLPTCSYEELCKIIKAYARKDEAVDLKAISDLTGMGSTAVSGNNAFLAACGIVVPVGKLKQSTPSGQQLGHALEHEIAPEIASAWRAIVEQTEFLKKIVTAVAIRKGMDGDALHGHIAYSAGVPKESRFMTGARAVADILISSGLIVEKDGKVMPADGNGSPVPRQTQSDAGTMSAMPSIFQTDSPGVQTRIPIPGQSGLTVHLEIRLNATPDDLLTLGTKLRKMLDDLSQSREEKSNYNTTAADDGERSLGETSDDDSLPESSSSN